jgi:hypothetical protein
MPSTLSQYLFIFDGYLTMHYDYDDDGDFLRLLLSRRIFRSLSLFVPACNEIGFRLDDSDIIVVLYMEVIMNF